MNLTPAGELLLPYAQRLVADEANARAQLRSYLGLERGRLRLGLIQTSASAVDVTGSMTEFNETFAGIDIQITSDPLIRGRPDADASEVSPPRPDETAA